MTEHAIAIDPSELSTDLHRRADLLRDGTDDLSLGYVTTAKVIGYELAAGLFAIAAAIEGLGERRSE